jgi:hypothetical protein
MRDERPSEFLVASPDANRKQKHVAARVDASAALTGPLIDGCRDREADRILPPSSSSCSKNIVKEDVVLPPAPYAGEMPACGNGILVWALVS